MQRGKLDCFIAENQNLLEYEASVIAQSLILTGKWKKILGYFSSKNVAGKFLFVAIEVLNHSHGLLMGVRQL